MRIVLSNVLEQYSNIIYRNNFKINEIVIFKILHINREVWDGYYTEL